MSVTKISSFLLCILLQMNAINSNAMLLHAILKSIYVNAPCIWKLIEGNRLVTLVIAIDKIPL